MSPLLQYLLENEPQFKSKARLSALYSDFTPLATLNPDGYAANINAWQTSLSHALLSPTSNTPSKFSLNLNTSLLRELNTDQWGMPLALGTVVKEALDKREWIEHNEFLTSQESVIRSKGWGIRIPSARQVVGWGWRTVSGFVFSPATEGLGKDRKVVVIENLEHAATRVQGRMEGVKGRTERVMSRADFKTTFADCVGSEKKLSEEDVVLLIKYLERDKRVLVTNGSTIRFKASGENEEESISEQDSTIANLRSLIRDIVLQIGTLEVKVEELTSAAKVAVAKNHRTSALAALKSKKMTEATLAKRHATLTQLEEVFNSIEQASDQIELVKVMEDSGRVLAGLNKEVGGVERVDNVVDALREQMSVVNEVGDVINEVGRESAVDETEVDEEFEEMERVEKEKREAIERLAKEEETRKKLAELEEVEKAAKENAIKQGDILDELDKSTDGMKRMSLEPNADGTVAQ